MEQAVLRAPACILKAQLFHSAARVLLIIIVLVGSGITPIQVENQPRPGILTVTLYEGTGFNVPGSHKQVFNSLQHDRASNRVMLAHMLPYAILDFDKSQVSVPSYSGTPENPKWVGDMPPFKLMFPGLVS